MAPAARAALARAGGARPRRAARRAGALDYDAILDRLAAGARAGATGGARPMSAAERVRRRPRDGRAAPTRRARIGRALVEERLAACVNVVGPIRSIYRWQGAVEEADEHLLVVKARAADVPALEARVRALHSYDVPEVLALPVTAGSAAYLAWLAERDRPRRLSRAAGRPPVTREFSAGGLVYRRARGRWVVCLGGARGDRQTGRCVWSIPKGHVEDGREHGRRRRCARCARRPGSTATIEEPLGDVTYWYARRDEDGAAGARLEARALLPACATAAAASPTATTSWTRCAGSRSTRRSRPSATTSERALVRRARERLERGGR